MSDSKMRYIKVPKSRKVKMNQFEESRDADGKVIRKPLGTIDADYTYFDMMREHVWIRSEWRDNETNANVYNRMRDAHDEAEESKLPYIPATQEDFAIFSPFATLKGRNDIGGPNVDVLNRLSQAVIFAKDKKPEDYDEVMNPKVPVATLPEKTEAPVETPAN